MKKIIKNRIFIVIITLIIGVSGTLYATTKYQASEVLYNPSSGNSMTVNEALNDLYKNCNNGQTNMQYRLENKTYEIGESVSWAGLNWYAINDDTNSTTLILKNNYATGLYGNSTTFKGSTAYNSVNIDFIDNSVQVADAIKTGAVVQQGTFENSPYYVRLPQQTELSNSIPNSSGTAFWTMSSADSGMYIGTLNGALAKEYKETSTAKYYNGYSSSLAGITGTGITAVDYSDVLVASNATSISYYNSYTTYKSSTQYEIVYNNTYTGVYNAYNGDCNQWKVACPNDYGCTRKSQTWYTQGGVGGTFNYNTGGEVICGRTTIYYANSRIGTFYTLTDQSTSTLGYRPVVTVYKK